MAKSLEVCALAGVRRPTLPATRGLCRPQSPLVFSAHPETPTAASTISQPRQTCRAAPVGAQVPWTTWGRFAHNSSGARVEVHLPFPNPAPTIGNLNPYTTVLKPLVGLGHAKPSSNPPTTTLQPSFVSNPRSTRSRHNHPTSCPKTVQCAA